MITYIKYILLKTVQHFCKTHGYAPTNRELSDILEYKSTATIHGHLDRLRKKGYITMIDSCPRTLRIVKDFDESHCNTKKIS